MQKGVFAQVVSATLFLVFLSLLSFPNIIFADAPSLFQDTPSQRTFRVQKKKRWVRSQKEVALNSKAFDAGSFEVSFNGKRLRGLKSNARHRGPIYTSSLTDTTKGPLLDGNEIVGSFTIAKSIDKNGNEAVNGLFELRNGESYNLQYQPDGSYLLEEIDHSAFPNCPVHDTEPFDDFSYNENAANPDVSAADNTTIDVLVGYTPAALTQEGSEAAMLAKINLAIANANEAYTNSGVGLTLNLVYAVALNEESTDFSTDLNRLRTNGDGYFDEVHTLRETYKADMVALMRDSGEYCGIGYLPSSSDSLEYGNLSYSVTAANCVSYHSFAHELGHNLGLQHDSRVASGTPFYSYSYGYMWNGSDSNKYRSVMAYDDPSGFGSSSRVAYFSNPDINHMGAATGSATANNAQTLTNNIATVAAFRESTGETFNGGGGSEEGGGGEESSLYSTMTTNVRLLRNGKYRVRAVFKDENNDPVEGIPVTITESRRSGSKLTLITNSSSNARGKVVTKRRAKRGLTEFIIVADDTETQTISKRNRSNRNRRRRR